MLKYLVVCITVQGIQVMWHNNHEIVVREKWLKTTEIDFLEEARIVIISWDFRIEALIILFVKIKLLVINQVMFNFYVPHNIRVKDIIAFNYFSKPTFNYRLSGKEGLLTRLISFKRYHSEIFVSKKCVFLHCTL